MFRAAAIASVAVLGFIAAPAADAALITFVASLSPANETPPVVGSTASGSTTITYDNIAHTLLVQTNWTGLAGTSTASHIHCCALPTTTAGVAVTPTTLPGFPTGTTSGSYTSPLLDLTAASTYTTAFVNSFAGGVVANAESVLIQNLMSGMAYFNIHSTFAPGGEIRGTIAVPEPATLSLVSLGVLGLLGLRRRRKA